MPRHPDRKGATSRRLSEVRSLRELGRLTIGNRCFTIVLASDLGENCGIEEVYRFEIGNVSLVAFENPIPRQQADIPSDDIAAKLTGRELEIAILVARGHATKNIAHKLQISEWTVATYLRRIFAKLDVYSRAAMVYRCASLIDRTVEFYDRTNYQNDISAYVGEGLNKTESAKTSLVTRL